MNWEKFATNIFWHETLHFFCAVILFILFFVLYNDYYLSLVTFVFSLAIDSDHYLESLIFYKFNLIKIIKDKRNCWLKTGKMTILLHSWELIFILTVLGKYFNLVPLFLSLSFALFFHLFLDIFVYSLSCNMPIYNYSFFYRLWLKFDFVTLYNNGKKKQLTKEEIAEKYGKK